MFKFRKVKSCLFAASAVFPERLVSRHRYYKRKSIWLPAIEKAGTQSAALQESSTKGESSKNRGSAKRSFALQSKSLRIVYKASLSTTSRELLSKTCKSFVFAKKRIHSSMRLSGQFEPIIELENDKKQDISGRASHQLSLSKRECWNHTRKKVKTILQLHSLIQKGRYQSSSCKKFSVFASENMKDKESKVKQITLDKSRINTSFTDKTNNPIENSKQSQIVPHLYGLLRSGERFSRKSRAFFSYL